MRIVITRDFRTDVRGSGPVAFRRGQRVEVSAMPKGHTAEKWVENGLARWPHWWAAVAAIVLADGAGLPRAGMS